ncbi:MAG: helicase [Acidimicrobiia bacterium]
MSRTARGSVSVLLLGLVALSVALALAWARVGSTAIAARQAEIAADAAALAGADQLALGHSCGKANAVATAIAAANRARIVAFRCGGADLQITTVVREPVRRSARAVVDNCWWCAGGD